MIKINKDPELVEKRKKVMKKLWDDPELRGRSIQESGSFCQCTDHQMVGRYQGKGYASLTQVMI